jgi:hypothetical protein
MTQVLDDVKRSEEILSIQYEVSNLHMSELIFPFISKFRLVN